MREETQKTKAQNKITSIEISQQDIENPEMDRLVRESLIQEADALEKELSERPELIGVGASDDLFGLIVAKLKERGTWQEEEPQGGADGQKERGEMSAAAEESGARQQDDGGSVRCFEDCAPAQKEASQAAPEQHAAAQSTDAGQSRSPEELEKLYEMLPEEDRRALELGREAAKKERSRSKRRARAGKVFRYSGVAAAMLAVVFGVSMTSEANRRLVLDVWEGFLQDFGFKIRTNYADDVNNIRGRNEQEVAAMEEISGQLGCAPIYFNYLPEGMEYLSYHILENPLEAGVFYSYNNQIINMTVMKIAKESATYWTLNEDFAFREIITSTQGVEAEISETNLDLEEEAYVAKIEYQDCQYILNGKMPLGELEKILEEMILL